MSLRVLQNHYPSMENTPKKNVVNPCGRKKYIPPELSVYGSLVELTRSGLDDPPNDAIFAGCVHTG
jgi:hypothetical protein